MKLYNTAARQIEEIIPQHPPEIGVYTCGPTVYDYAHIGHWFNYVRMDSLIRTLKANGYKPKWVMNITDVGHLVSDADEGEDKLEKGARREGKTAWEVAEFYTKDFFEGMRLLNILTPEHIVKATEHIPEQIALIEKLEAKGYVYIIDDGVYYDTSKFPTYGDFARLDLEEQQAGARVTVNQQKRNQSDFALWKFSPKDHRRDMEWDSPWGKGFPGWHIECSAMSMKYLGNTIDVHTGGIDHIPVHHTNEIAQSEAATGEPFARYWLHSNHVMVDGEKISKSLGNGIRLQEIIERGITAEAVRLHILESHYRSQSKFSFESLQAAQNRLRDLKALSALRWQAREQVQATNLDLDQVQNQLRDIMADDLNTPQALALLSSVANQLLTAFVTQSEVAKLEAMLQTVDDLFGLNLLEVADLSETQKATITEREAARHAQNWQRSDELRDQLQAEGIGVRDTPQGTIWFPL